MTDIHEETRSKLRRTLGQEFERQQEDFDDTRSVRKEIINKLMDTVRAVDLVTAPGDDGKCTPFEDTSTRLALVTSTLKALSDAEKANVNAITLKLRHQEAEAASAAAHKDRLLAVIQATAPGAITGSFPSEDMDKHLEEMFDSNIQDFELKTSPRDLSDG